MAGTTTTYRPTTTELCGPVAWRTTNTLTAGKLATTANVLRGTMGGAYFIAEGWGNSANFEELAMDFAGYDPTGVGGAVGLVFNYRMSSAGKQFYAVMMRNHTSETGIGVYKVEEALGRYTALGTVVTTASFAANRADWGVMTTNSVHLWTRLHVSFIDGRIRVWLNNDPSRILIDVTDSTPLAAGSVGLHLIGMAALVVDNAYFAALPRCNDGILNGDEERVDCGGSCPTACTRTSSVTYSWSALNDGAFGLTHATYGDNPNGAWFGAAHIFPPGTDFMVMPQNVNGLLPGSTGTNAAGWIGSWWSILRHLPALADIDLSIEVYPNDNDVSTTQQLPSRCRSARARR